MNREPERRVITTNSIFNDNYLDSKQLYMYTFESIPSVHLTQDIDDRKAWDEFRKVFSADIKSIHQYTQMEPRKSEHTYSTGIVVMKRAFILEFGSGYCEILHNEGDKAYFEQLANWVKRFRQRKARKRQEINLIIKDGYGELALKHMDIRKQDLDLSLYYEDNFVEIDKTIRQRLNKHNDKGIVLLHGLPGTGKTTYLRYLIGKIKKKVMFLSPGIASNLMHPDFIDLLISNPNSVLIIEDAEHIIMDRKLNSDSSVSGLLNISDGLMADCLNVQVICTFNSDLSAIDNALLRKGRLIARYEFTKLSAPKVQRLSAHLGLAGSNHEPMTLAEIVNQQEKAFEIHKPVIGFRATL